MLTKEDIAFIKKTRKEVIYNRLKDLEIIHRGGSKRNQITGVMESTELKTMMKAVVTDITTKGGVASERRIVEQAIVEEGDIWFSIAIDELNGIKPSDIVKVNHNGQYYKIVADDPKGLGEYNRYEFVGRLMQ